MMTQKQVRKTKEGISFGLKVLLGILFISPLIIGFLFSIQYEDELTSSPLRLFTANPTLINYIEVFQKVPLLSYLKNSLIVCVLAITIQIIVASLAAYGFSFFEFKGKKFLFGLVLASMMIPGEVVVITNFVTVQNLGLTNTYLGLIITSLIGGTSIFMMRQYFLTLSKDFKEAATLDGCGDIGFLFRIALPLSLPTLSSLAVYLFVSIYNHAHGAGRRGAACRGRRRGLQPDPCQRHDRHHPHGGCLHFRSGLHHQGHDGRWRQGLIKKLYSPVILSPGV